MTDRLTRITTALAAATVAAVAAVAAVISYRDANERVSTHEEPGLSARLVPFTMAGLILAASMLILDASRRNQPTPPLARWCLGAGRHLSTGRHPSISTACAGLPSDHAQAKNRATTGAPLSSGRVAHRGGAVLR
ncbi:MAG: DUF2637 domain-containing protein [Streptosporangiaceae bacterium]